MIYVRIATKVNTLKYQSRRIACMDYMNFRDQDVDESLFSLLIPRVRDLRDRYCHNAAHI